MGTYRVGKCTPTSQSSYEISPNNRAGCKDTACKAQGEKIKKGELRFATMVEIQEKTSWSYKHWGCVTPAQFVNVKTSLDNDVNNLDGYEDISPELQEKVKKAIEEGHVADEDWRGDVEFNRPGKKGKGKRAAKVDDEEDKLDEDEPKEDDAKLVTKKRSRAKKDVGDEDKPVATKKAKTAPKNAKVTATAVSDIETDEEVEEPTIAKKVKPESKKAKAASTVIDSSAVDKEEKPTTAKKGKTESKKAKITATAAGDAGNNEDKEESTIKKAKSSAKKTKTTAAVTKDGKDNDQQKSVPKKTRNGGKAKPMLPVDDETDDEADLVPVPKDKSDTKKAKATAAKVEKGEKEKATTKTSAKAHGKTSPTSKGRKVAPKSAEHVEDSDGDDREGEVDVKKAGKKPNVTEAKVDKKSSGKAKPKGQGAQKVNVVKEKKVKKSSAKD